ncbi:MAG: 4-hydroxythreonine-4-phosphate dehydrogenase PdxA [Halarcobacter ebronensis]
MNEEDLTTFFFSFQKSVNAKKIGQVLGFNPHASDNGVLGNEEVEIFKAIKKQIKN